MTAGDTDDHTDDGTRGGRHRTRETSRHGRETSRHGRATSPHARATSRHGRVAGGSHRRPGRARAPGAGHLSRAGLRVLRTGALLGLTVIVAMAGCVIAARAIGWQAAVVVSGSMRPVVQVGDVVLADPRGKVAPGRIVLVRRPGFAGQLLTHRVVRVLGNGELVTRGDGNAVNDPVPVPRQDVLGLVRLVVPQIGRPLTLRRDPSGRALVGIGLLLAAVPLLAASPPGRRRVATPRRPASDRPRRSRSGTAGGAGRSGRGGPSRRPHQRRRPSPAAAQPHQR